MPTTKTGYWVRVQNGQVTDVWDTNPPAGQDGWNQAVEIIPDSAGPDRDFLTGHTIDITKNPIEIVYSQQSISFEDRKQMYLDRAEGRYQMVVREQDMREQMGETKDQAAIDAALAARDAVIPRINACNTHEDLDAVRESV